MKQLSHNEFHGMEEFPEILEGSEGMYSVDVLAVFIMNGEKRQVFYAYNANRWYYESEDIMIPITEDFQWMYIREE